ncbi:hypothetical protein J2Z40_000400 [Cytobacillus eiseniae]|uniref:DUF3298 domain-containing protein n=1 Tax=Cytobacillus eiseniae TaxID=762947 RepID=A0ABS4RAC9_9BACI|nr:DUF3298 and DUF4163 domain-containing protein [Cytobacillus eiseniae]MBP2239847.1 hypothetical protein [Cytobacillus eiseniae]
MPVSLPLNIHTLKTSDGKNKKVFYPQVIDAKNQQFQKYMNQMIVHQVQLLINEQVQGMPSSVVEMLGSYEMKNNQRDVLSLTLSNYTYHDKAAHGLTLIKSLTFDQKKERLCELKDLFKPGSNYVKRLSALIQNQIKDREIMLLDHFTKIKPNQDFYIADKTIVIFFQLYEITPYVFGFPMFPISVYDLIDIIDENGPLGRMAENN